MSGNCRVQNVACPAGGELTMLEVGEKEGKRAGREGIGKKEMDGENIPK